MKNLISEAFSCLVILQINWKGTTKPKLYEKKMKKKNNGIGGWWQFYFEVITCLYRWCHIYIVLLINLILPKKTSFLTFIILYTYLCIQPTFFTHSLSLYYWLCFYWGILKKGSCEKKSQSLHFIRLLFLRNIFFSICKLIFWYFILTFGG